MKFSIVTSFHNGSKYIDFLYEKVKSQTYTNWEWIITEDFSNEEDRQKLIEISKKDRKVKFVEQEYKKQMFYNPQIFCRDAEIIMQLDQDDYFFPKALEVYHHFFTKFQDTVLISCAGNTYREDGSWFNFYCPEYTNVKNMTCGYIAYLRAWRNNPNSKYDFNPDNWMKYYYNDLSILLDLEERGKVLNLPRNLYHCNYRERSVSRTDSDEDVINEGSEIIRRANKRRLDPNIDTLNRYFESIHKECLCLLDDSLNDSNTQQKISFINENIDSKKEPILKELFFDHIINVNKIEGDEDFLVFVVKDESDIDLFFEIDTKFNFKKISLVIYNHEANEYKQDILSKIQKKYALSYRSAHNMIINILK